MRIIQTMFVFLALTIPATLFGQIRVSISIGPPPLPVYEQPLCPGDGYLWTPGYWAYDESVSDYYWVGGLWVMAPQEGLLWTPGYWGWSDRGYLFNEGYWGTEVGFYGGINYGYGYYGIGYGGGRWDGGHFFYNRSENRIDAANIHNVYEEKLDHGRDGNRVSFNGGAGGIDARANAQQEAVSRNTHIAPVAFQTEHAQTARSNPELRATSNHGNPSSAAEPAPQSQEKYSEVRSPRVAIHPNDLAPFQRPDPVDSGNARADRKYQQQQDSLTARQNQERQSLQQQQDNEHQRLTQQKASDFQTQQVEQKHQQQTHQMSERHAAQQQSLQSRQPQSKQRQDHPDGKH